MKHRLLLTILSLFLLNTTLFAYEYTDDQGVVYPYDPSGSTAYVSNGKSASGAVVIPAKIQVDGKTYTVTSIGGGAFSGCTGLTSVTIPKVESIGQQAFQGCTGLTSVTIGNSVTDIGYCAFNGCTGLTSVTIPNSVESIGQEAFAGCTGLTSITIGNSVASIGGMAFNGCNKLEKVCITDLAAWCNIYFEKYHDGFVRPSRDEYSANPLRLAHHLYMNNEEITDLIIPESVTDIWDRAFSGCTGLKSVTIPNSVESIGSDVFEGCTGLTSAVIGNSVESIGYGAFYGCTGLTSVTIGNSVTEIGSDTFGGCAGLASITFGSSLISIGERAFENCGGLTSIDFPNSVTSIGSSAFCGCTGLTSLTLPNSITSIGMNAFTGCSSITSLTIGNSITNGIDRYAFVGCSALTTLILGCSVEKIGESAFARCNNITKIISLNPTPPSCWNAFTRGFRFVTSYVPVGSKSAYEQEDPWKYSNIIEGTGEEYSISVNSTEGGSVKLLDTSVSGTTISISVEYGEDVVLNTEANEGYRLLSLVINGKDVTADIVDGRYTIEDIGENISVIATFEENKTVAYMCDINGDGDVNTADVTAVYNFIQNGDASGFSSEVADINSDDDVNTADVVAIYNYIINGSRKVLDALYDKKYKDSVNIFRWAITADDKYVTNPYSSPLNGFFSKYLSNSDCNFSLFVPTDNALKHYYDPVSMCYKQPYMLEFNFDENNSAWPISAFAYKYDPNTHQTDSVRMNRVITSAQLYNRLKDMLNAHIIMHDKSDEEGINDGNIYYTTKGGAPIKVTDPAKGVNGGKAQGAWQIEHDEYCNIQAIYDQSRKTNGMTYIIDRPLQSTIHSVYSVLSDHGNEDSPYAKFFDLCCVNPEVIEEAGFLDGIAYDRASRDRVLNNYAIFTSANPCMDFNVRFFDNYYYTVYIPTNAAIEAEIAKGLPTWESIGQFIDNAQQEILYKREHISGYNAEQEDTKAYRLKAQAMCIALLNFIKYHFQSGAVYNNNLIVAPTSYETACFDAETGNKLTVSVHNTNGNTFTVKDQSGNSRQVYSNARSNIMTRDLQFDKAAASATMIETSSFAVLHQIDGVLNFTTLPDGRYDGLYDTPEKAKAFMEKYPVK